MRPPPGRPARGSSPAESRERVEAGGTTGAWMGHSRRRTSLTILDDSDRHPSDPCEPEHRSAPRTLRAVLFDFGGTLDADGVTWKERFFRLCRDEGLALGARALRPRVLRADDALVGAIPETLSFEDTVGRLATGVSEARSASGDGARARPGRPAASSTTRARPVERNRPLLARLAARYRLGIVSNFYGNLAAVCRDLRYPADSSACIVDSTQVGVTKPDPRIFRRALDGLGVPPADAVFVGDSPARDMAGRRGRRACATSGWPGEAPPRAEPCCPGDRVVRSLEEVERLLL